MADDLDDVFNDASPEQPKVEQQEPEAPEPPIEGENGSEPAPADEKEGAPAASETSPEPTPPQENTVPLTAVLDERRKRQALEAELAELKQQREPEKVPDVIDNPNEYTNYVSQKIDQGMVQARISMSQEFMRMQDSEYDAKEAEFLEMAQQNPQLGQQLVQHAMPAKFVVETVDKARELKRMDNVDEYKAQLRAEVEAQVRKELELEIQAEKEKASQMSKLKPSLANARSSKDQSDPVDLTLDDLFD